MPGDTGQGKKPRTSSAKASGAAPRPSFKAAARGVTKRPAPTRRRGRKARQGGEARGRSFTTGALAEDYLRLCRDPLRDLQRWMDEDKKRKGAGHRAQPITKRGDDAGKDTTRTENHLVNAQGLRGEPLHELQGRMDAHGDDGRRLDGLSARPRASASRYDGLRQVRAEGRAGDGLGRSSGDAAELFALGSELAAVSSYYAAKIVAVRRGFTPRDIAAAVRAIRSSRPKPCKP